MPRIAEDEDDDTGRCVCVWHFGADLLDSGSVHDDHPVCTRVFDGRLSIFVVVVVVVVCD